MSDSLVYIGKIIAIEAIPNADFIVSATVVCGAGGKWRGIVKKDQFNIDDKCVVYLPDALISESENMAFMKSTDWRVKMRKFKGAPSEVLIMPYPYENLEFDVGVDMTFDFGVTKYHKPMPPSLSGIAVGYFPDFIPKTDEPNYQNMEGQQLVEALIGKPYYITEKCDGSSTTAFRYKGKFGICSRNLEVAKDDNNGYWKIALRHNLEETLPEGIAIQWETVGPGIQGNPMGWKDIQGLMFSAYNIEEERYFTFVELCNLSLKLKFTMVMIYKSHECFSTEGLELLGEGVYDNGKQREGVVVRSTDNLLGDKPISFKVINLNYEK